MSPAGTFKDGPSAIYPTGGDIGESSLGGGWQAAYEFNDLFSLEGLISAQRDDLPVSVLSEPFSADLDLNIVSFALTARAGWFFDPVSVYAGAGIGYYFFDGDADAVRSAIDGSRDRLPAGVSSLNLNNDIDDAVGTHLALGAEWMITKRWEVFAEYRMVFLETDIRYRVDTGRPNPDPVTTTPTLVTTQSSEETLSYDHGVVRIGLNYRF